MENKKLRKATKKDLKDFKYDPFSNCAVCELDGIYTMGAYRGSDFYMCKACFLKGTSFEVPTGLAHLHIRPRTMEGFLCGKCTTLLYWANLEQYKPFLFKCKGGHYKLYCSEACAKAHNHRFHYEKGLKRIISKLRTKCKLYYSYLKQYGYGGS